MALPSTVTQRAEGNDFVDSTGVLVSGVTGFALRTGFYLTNSGNYPIETRISTSENFAFDIPSGIDEPIVILAGETTLIPFDFNATMPNTGPTSWGVGAGSSTGPDHHGTWAAKLNLNFRSAYDSQEDPEGTISVYITGQATGRSTQTPSGPGLQDWCDTLPEKPTGVLVKSSYAPNGRPQAELHWQHPATGYYLVRYKLESAQDINNDNTSATGTWSHETYFNINYTDVTVPSEIYQGPSLTTSTTNSTFPYRKYASPTGIFQRYTRGTDNNEETSYGEVTFSDRAFDIDHYYRIKSEYFNQANGATIFESPYVYAYPVTDFKASLPADVAAGLESGNTTLPSSSSSNIKVDRQRPQALEIYLNNGQPNINLYDTVTDELASRSIDKTWLTTGDANYTFSGIHWIIPETYRVGSTDSSKAGVDTGSQLLNSSTTHQQEITGVLIMEAQSAIFGKGGDGGNGGHVTIEQFDVNVEKPSVSIGTITASTDGAAGTAAIRISDSNIDKFSIRKDATAQIAGGGGGGGAGDPLIQPKIFDLNSQKIHQIQFGEDMKTLTNKGKTPKLGKVVSGLQKNDSKGETTVKIDLVAPGGRSGNGMWTVDLSSYWFKYSVDFSLSDIVGLHNAGIGGGGQGFGSSYPGKFLNTSLRPLPQDFPMGYGSLARAGEGSRSSIKLSAGAGGGLLGLDGHDGVSIDFDDFFQPSDAIDGNKTAAKDGGAAGRAMDATGNSNYTKANFKTKLCRIKGVEREAITSFSDINGFVAHFDAGQNVYEDAGGTDAAENGDLVKRWASTNDAANIYMVQNNAASSAPTYQSSSTSIPAKYFSDEKCILFDGNIGGGLTLPGNVPDNSYDLDKRLKIKGITGTDKIEDGMDGFDVFYFLYPLDSTYTLYDFSGGQGHYYWTRYLHYWTSGGGYPVFFDGAGSVSECMGLGKTGSVRVGAEAASHPKEEGYVWNITGKLIGREANLTLYRGEQAVASSYSKSTGFNFMSEPILGGMVADDNVNLGVTLATQWWGGISQMVVFNRRLTFKERKAVNNLLNEKVLKTKTTTAAEIAAWQSENPLMKNKEPFRNLLTDGKGFGGFCVFDS